MSKSKVITRREFVGISIAGGAALLAPGSVIVPGAVGAASAAEDQVLRIATGDFSGENLDPLLRSASDLLAAVYDTAFRLNPDASLAPGVVTTWENAPDGSWWLFKIRDDVYFHAGKNADGSDEPERKVTAEDVAFSFARAVSEENAEYGAEWRKLIGEQPQIDLIDEHTLRLHMKKADAFLPAKITHTYQPKGAAIVSKAYIEKNGLDWFRRNPIGSGPYRYVLGVPGDRREFEAVERPHFWSGVPAFKRLVDYRVPEQSTQVAMLQNGELDGIGVSLENALRLEAEGFRIVRATGGYDNFWFIGAFHPEGKGMPIADVRVRQALNLAVNRQEVIDALFHGFAELPGPPQAGWYFGGWDDPAIKAKWKAWCEQNYRYDPDKAKQLLTEAGYPQGFDVDLWFAANPESPYQKDLVEAVVSYFQAIGVRANLVIATRASWDAERVLRDSTKLIGKMGVINNSGTNPTAFNGLRYFTNFGSLDVYHGSPLEDEMTALVSEGLASTDVARRVALLDKALEIIAPTFPSVQIITGPKTFAFGPRVEPVVPSYATTLHEFTPLFKYTGKEQ